MRRLQPVLSVFSIILISSIVVFLRLLRPERFLEPSEIDNVLNYMGSLDLKVFYYFPFSWLARAMSLTADGTQRPLLEDHRPLRHAGRRPCWRWSSGCAKSSTCSCSTS